MTTTFKTGSPIRRGFDYQDVTALSITLEIYIQNLDFQVFLEYGKPGGLDDIVVVLPSEVHGYQIKHAENPLDAYQLQDFTNLTDKRVLFSKFSAAWQELLSKFPDRNVKCHLLSNRSLDRSFLKLLDTRGSFTPDFVENRFHKEPRSFRQALKQVCALEESQFKDFLSSFEFNMNQRSLGETEDFVKGTLLDHKLGISEQSVFYDLMAEIRTYATVRTDPITCDLFDRVLRQSESRHILPQKFNVDESTFVSITALHNRLDSILSEADGEYVVITGLPGSGKSTSLTNYFDKLSGNFVIVKYYCFVGINDNRQKRRLEAQSLRTNILSELQRRFSGLLDRRFDYGEEHFLTALETIGKHLKRNSKKLIVFLDGLDHAERDDEVLNNVLTALPGQIPEGVVLLIGTQELSRWQPLALKKARAERNVEMPLFSQAETQEYFAHQGLSLQSDQLNLVQEKSQGLPLYLAYVAQLLKEHGWGSMDFSKLPPAEKGQIRTYYETLWDAFEARGRGKSRYLCAVAVCLDFKIHKDEFLEFQNEVSRSEFDEAFRAIRHLLRIEESMMSVFHDSFRVFVRSRLSGTIKTEIMQAIAAKLKAEKDTPRWYQHSFAYAYQAGDDEYVIDQMNKDFVDGAMRAFRPNIEIMEVFGWAVEAAKRKGDLRAMAFLGPLKYRTNERIEENVDHSLLAKTLLYLGRKEEVITFSCQLQNNRWLVSQDVALDLIIWCAETNQHELGRKLFAIFTETFRSDDDQNQRHTVTRIGRCLGYYGTNRRTNLRWLSAFKFSPDYSDDDYLAPVYAPHIEAYIDAGVQVRNRAWVGSLKRIKTLFPNKAIRHFIIRSRARQGDLKNLRLDIREYIERYSGETNLELAAYAAMAGLPDSEVRRLAGQISNPPKTPSDRAITREYVMELDSYLLGSMIMSYERSPDALAQVYSSFVSLHSYWAGIMRFIIKAGECIGACYANRREEILSTACQALRELLSATQAEGERIIETHDAIRKILPRALHWLTEAVEKTAPDQLPFWSTELLKLRDSNVWRVHYGIMESIRDYSFELAIWDKLADRVAFRSHLHPILECCYKDYKSARNIKGGSRSQHFLWLASIAAKCGFRSDALNWIALGVEATNIYGYHKDITLSRLIDVADLTNKRIPNGALRRAAAILELVKWMGSLTDWKETKYFPQEAFALVLANNRSAALDLIRYYSDHSGRWNMLDCLADYICSKEDGDPDFLWALCELFAPNFSDAGRHPQQVIRARKHVVQLAEKRYGTRAQEEWNKRLNDFIRTSITPRYWPDELCQSPAHTEDRPPREKEDATPSPAGTSTHTYILNGKEVSVVEIKSICLESLSNFIETMDKLRTENKHFWESTLTNEVLSRHIENSTSAKELLPIKEYLFDRSIYRDSDIAQKLAQRFEELGDYENACSSREMAFCCIDSWQPHKRGRPFLEAIKVHDKQRLTNFLLDRCYQNLQGTHGGFDLPALVATGFDLLDDVQGLETVFNDYLNYCQELFSHLPSDDQYGWLRDYVSSKDENDQIIQFLIDELDDREIDLGERLVKVIASPVLINNEVVLPSIVDRLSGPDETRTTRLLVAIQAIGNRYPHLLAQYWERVWAIGKKPNFQRRLLLIRLMEKVFNDSRMPETLKNEIDHAKFNYSSAIRTSSYRLLATSPSTDFLAFARKATLYDFQQQVDAVTEILDLDKKSVLADLERRLYAEGWDIKVAEEERKDDWDGNVHAQGWPIVWIEPHFHTRISMLFYAVLDEYMQKMKFQESRVEAVWRVIQPADPEFVSYAVQPKPTDIPALWVKDKETWLKELRDEDDEIVFKEMPAEGWVTLFEYRRNAEDTKYDVPYVNEIWTRSVLVDPAYAISIDQVRRIRLWQEPLFDYHPDECLTWEQIRNLLTSSQHCRIDLRAPAVPAISLKQNPILFLGFHLIASLPSHVVTDFDLSFRGLDLHNQSKRITCFDYWREGYVDESYCRDPLSWGVRLRVDLAFLRSLTIAYGRHLCRKTTENRLHYRSLHDRHPDAKSNRTVFEFFQT